MPLDVESPTGEGSTHISRKIVHVVYIDWLHSREDNFNEIHAIATTQLVLTSRMASQRMMVLNVSLFTESQMAGLAAITWREYR